MQHHHVLAALAAWALAWPVHAGAAEPPPRATAACPLPAVLIPAAESALDECLEDKAETLALPGRTTTEVARGSLDRCRPERRTRAEVLDACRPGATRDAGKEAAAVTARAEAIAARLVDRDALDRAETAWADAFTGTGPCRSGDPALKPALDAALQCGLGHVAATPADKPPAERADLALAACAAQDAGVAAAIGQCRLKSRDLVVAGYRHFALDYVAISLFQAREDDIARRRSLRPETDVLEIRRRRAEFYACVAVAARRRAEGTLRHSAMVERAINRCGGSRDALAHAVSDRLGVDWANFERARADAEADADAAREIDAVWDRQEGRR